MDHMPAANDDAARHDDARHDTAAHHGTAAAPGPATPGDTAIPRVVLSPDDLDLLELALGGAGVVLAVDRTQVGDDRVVVLTDAENTPLARAHLSSVPDAPAHGVVSDGAGVPVSGLDPLQPFAPVPGASGAAGVRLSLTEARLRHAGRPVVVLRDVPTRAEIAAARRWAAQHQGTAPVWLVTVPRTTSDPSHATVRVLERMLADGDLDGDLVVLPRAVAGAGSALAVLSVLPTDTDLAGLWGAGPVLDLADARVSAGRSAPETGPTASETALGAALSAVFPRRGVEELLPRQTSGRGAVVLFSGLSGSGKSTVAKAFAHRVETEGRAVVLLDGDESRQMLSAGLGFDRRSRDLNIERLGYVAAIASSLGAIAVTAPIAPFAGARAAVRERALGVGAYLLVHVSTPLEVCEARDRKGLYAQARAGKIAEFTGISSPYEEPDDADVTIDTSVVSVEEAVETVVVALAAVLEDLGGPGGPAL